MKPTAASLAIALLLVTGPLTACTETTTVQKAPESDADAGPSDRDAAPTEPVLVDGPSAELFGESASSYANVDGDGRVVAVGVTIPLAAFAAAPAGHAFQDDMVMTARWIEGEEAYHFELDELDAID
jgi:hypothetical protein